MGIKEAVVLIRRNVIKLPNNDDKRLYPPEVSGLLQTPHGIRIVLFLPSFHLEWDFLLPFQPWISASHE